MDVNELKQIASDYLGVTVEQLQQMYENNWKVAVNDWHNLGHDGYYKETLAQIVGLVGFSDGDRTDMLLYPLNKVKPCKVLDFGAGIGTNSIALAERGFEVYYYDLEGKTQDFAKYLIRKLGLDIKFLNKEEMESMKFDIIITADVLEHVRQPMDIVRQLATQLNDNGMFLTTGLVFSVGPHTPMHLPENLKYREEYDRFMSKHFNLVFYQVTNKEIIYNWSLKTLQKRKI